MNDEVKRHLDDLDQCYDELRKLDFRIMYPSDPASWLSVYASGVVSRAMSLNYGFTTLIRSENYYAATHLIRLHLDNYLRFYAMWLVQDPEHLAYRVIYGEQLNQIEYARKKTYNDGFLAKQANKIHNWIKPLYKELCGYVHLGRTHMFQPVQVLNENTGLFGFTAVKTDFRVPDEWRIIRTKCMKRITELVCDLLEDACESREKSAQHNIDKPRSDIPVPFIAKPMTPIKYKYLGETVDAEYQFLETPDRNIYRVVLGPGEAVLMEKEGDLDLDKKVKWTQVIIHSSHVELPKDKIQAIGDGISATKIR